MNIGNGALIRAVLRRSQVTDVDVQLDSNYPVGAGLGGSSAAGVALAGALAAFIGKQLTPLALASLSRETEVEDLGIPGGYQDHYAAAIGGVQLQRYGHSIEIEQIPISINVQQSLARRVILLYTGQSRISAETSVLVRDAFIAGQAHVVSALARMKTLACEMATALRVEDLDALGGLVHEHWSHQRSLHPRITTARIDSIVHKASRHGALGSKALGASGGGCVMSIAAQGREDELAEALAPLGERIQFAIDTAGFTILNQTE